jgi:PAS domain S-box-containing protein
MRPDSFFSSLSTDEYIAMSPVLLQTVFNTVPSGIQVLTAIRNEQHEIIDFGYLLVNRALNGQNHLGKTFLTINSKHQDLFKHLVNAVNSKPAGGSMLCFALDGLARWFQVKYIKLGDGVLLSIEDITDKKMSEARSRESQQLFQQIAESSPDIVFIMDIATQLVTYANREIASELGYTKKQVMQMKNSFMDIIHKDDLGKIKEHLEKIKQSAANQVHEVEYRMKSQHGGISWYCTRTSVFKRNQSGIPTEALGISQNITTRKRQEEQNFTNLNLLKQAEEISEMGTWVYDLRNQKFTWSEGMFRLFELAPVAEVTPEIYLDYVPNEQAVTWKIIEKIRKGEPFEECIHLVIPGKGQKTVEIKATSIRDSDGNVASIAGVDRDITKQVGLESKVARLNENLLNANYDLATLNTEMKTIGSIALTDYRETLKHLYTNLEFITTGDAQNLSSAGRASIRRAQAAIQKMKLLTEDITAYLAVQIPDGNKTSVDINELIENIRVYATRKLKAENLHIGCTELPVIKAYPHLLSLLFHHLVENAMKFRQPGVNTIIHIGCEEKNGDEIGYSSAIARKKYIAITIKDNGVGFDPADAQVIFGMFYRSGSHNHKGSGMGLAICKKIMDIHGGFITAESIPGYGSAFNCYFPVED